MISGFKNLKIRNHFYFFKSNYTIFAKDFDMNKLLKFLWRGRKQGRCGRSPMLKIEKYAHIYLVFAHAREISKVCSYRSPWQTVYIKWSASSHWSSSLYCPMRKSCVRINETTHPTLMNIILDIFLTIFLQAIEAH